MSRMAAFLPSTTCRNWVSLKYAATQKELESTKARICCPAITYVPGDVFTLVRYPSTGARIFV